MLVTGDITATANNNSDVTFANSTLFSTCHAENNDFFKLNNILKFEAESIKSSFWDYFEALL